MTSDPLEFWDPWQDMAQADAARDATPVVDVTVRCDGLSRAEHEVLLDVIGDAVDDYLAGGRWRESPAASLTAIADREFEEAHHVAYAGAEAEARQSRVDRCLDWALLVVIVVLGWCVVMATGYVGWTLLTL